MTVKRTEIADLGEFGLIKALTKDFHQSIDTIKGVGDDAAVVKFNKENTLISTDFLIENIHFDLAYTPLKHLGYKAAIVNFSDIYAMNGTPKHITVSIAISNRFSVEALQEIYAGIHIACEKYNVDLIGGDTTTSEKGLIISVTVIGEANQQEIVYRNGAKEGDLIAVTGNLGAAYMGLQVLQREKMVYLENPELQPELNDENSYLIQRFLKPEAKKSVIEFFKAENIKPHAMMDISDGLSSEIFHICTQSGVGAEIEERFLPIEEQTFNESMKMNIDPTVSALNGGEDYELLFTFDKKDLEKISENEQITVIGEIKSKDKGIKLKSKGNNLYDLKAQGWISF
jgi:thiamine-monophosphate kinase